MYCMYMYVYDTIGIAPVVTTAKKAILEPNKEILLAQFAQQADKVLYYTCTCTCIICTFTCTCT